MKIHVVGNFKGDSNLSRWPLAFEQFIAEHAGSEAFVITKSWLNDAQQLAIPHGGIGSRVIVTRSESLPDAWRVSAHHSKDVCALRVFDPTNLPRGDGLVVDGQDFNAPLAISTADCLAVAITLESSTQIQLASCFHAGWRGYSAGIQQEVLNWMAKKNLSMDPSPEPWLKRLHVTIGPAIAGFNYPCGQDVETALTAHLECKLRTLPRWSNSLEIELENISIVREDTFSSSWWPSHRRAMAEGLTRAGRLVTHLCPPACPKVQNHVSKP
jgi:copper oxidase (laccase) domain-containing protein